MFVVAQFSSDHNVTPATIIMTPLNTSRDEQVLEEVPDFTMQNGMNLVLLLWDLRINYCRAYEVFLNWANLRHRHVTFTCR